MDDSIGIRDLRDALHANLARVASGRRLIVRNRDTEVAILRAAEANDDGFKTPLTEFRHTMRATIERARQRPQLLTLYGDPVAVMERYGAGDVRS